MTDAALNESQVREVDQVAELHVRRYFDHYLQTVVPKQEAAAREHVDALIKQHDADDKAHGGVEVKVSRVIWGVTGVALAAGAGGATIAELVGRVVGAG